MLRWLGIRFDKSFWFVLYQVFMLSKKSCHLFSAWFYKRKNLILLFVKKKKIREPKLKVVRHEGFFFLPQCFFRKISFEIFLNFYFDPFSLTIILFSSKLHFCSCLDPWSKECEGKSLKNRREKIFINCPHSRDNCFLVQWLLFDEMSQLLCFFILHLVEESRSGLRKKIILHLTLCF